MDPSLSIQQLKLKLSRGDNIVLSIVPIFLILIALFMLYITNFTKWYTSTPFSPSRSSKLEINLLFISICLLGIYMFHKKDQILKLTPVYSTIDINEKFDIVNSLASPFKWTLYKTDNVNYFEFYLLRVPFSLSIDLDIVILTDEKGFYINVTDIGKRWIFSWGAFQNWTTKIKSAIENELAKTH